MGRSLVGDAEIAVFLARGGVVARGPVGLARAPMTRRTPAPVEGSDTDPLGTRQAGRQCYVAAVEPQAERRVLGELGEAGVAAWLPECRVRRRDTRRAIMVLGAPEPVFPGYLMVWLDMARDFGGPDAAVAVIEGIDGVDRLLRQIGSPMPHPLPGERVAELRRQIDQAGGVLLIDQGHFKWRRGDRKREEICARGDIVRIVGGPFTSFNGLYLHPAAEGRIKILLDLFGRSTQIEIEEALALPIGELA